MQCKNDVIMAISMMHIVKSLQDGLISFTQKKNQLFDDDTIAITQLKNTGQKSKPDRKICVLG